ncbi:MAG: DUF1353 domain-containing protein [Rhodospirillales bacterium]|nr:DUF1353 domain-containing protein [Rhodospirillales bacterium]
MYSNKDHLKQLATEQFADGLAQVIAEQIEQDAQAQAERLPSTASRGEVAPLTLATLFLADRFYAKLDVGQFTARPLVSWNGMDKFVFMPDPDQPFAYTTAAGRKIEPRTMYTDGGSTPRILRGLKKFSSWGYAPAFIVHDWLFTAKKCQHQPDTDWTFPQSALVMAEAIKTLMEVGFVNFKGDTVRLNKAEDTLYLMYHAVNSFIAKDIWEDDESVVCIP